MMNYRNRIAVAATILCVGSTTILVSSTVPSLASTKSVFAQPRILRSSMELQQQLLVTFAKKDFVTAETVAQKMVALQPDRFSTHYNLGCMQARCGKPKAAIASLQTAVQLGFRGRQRLESDGDLASLKNVEGWNNVLRNAATPPIKAPVRRLTAGKIDGGVAKVDEQNTAWNPKLTQLQVFFEPLQKATSNSQIARGSDKVAQLLNKWHKAGTAAGLNSVLYDNHDRDHSNMNVGRFPQLTRIEYSEAAAKEKLSNGLQHHFQFNRTTLGNSSTSLVGGPFWRSQPRFAYTNTRSSEILALQYFRNHLYCYPEHRDYDPGINGKGGYGDVYPTNTPYLVISQGSSGSDRVFLDAIASTLAAFRPNVLKQLEANGTVYPCVQMILRRCLKSVTSDEDYLSGIAHPVVFDGQQLDPLRMIEMAHQMTLATLPPLAVLTVAKEEEGVPGRDYFDAAPREKLFTTPAAIARICRNVNGPKVMTIDATKSQRRKDVQLTWHWVILQGDPDRIQITPQNKESSIATISVKHHERRPIRAGSKMESSRVDVGVFVFNGTYYSPPSFVTFFWPEDEQREYNDDGTIRSVQYTDLANGGNYSDPTIVTPKKWKDNYLYSESGQRLGWNRTRADARERFTANGELVLTLDERDRPLRTQRVLYVAKPRPNLAPILQQVPGRETFTYTYSSDDDKIGRASPMKPAN